jgi:hypothetical protein
VAVDEKLAALPSQTLARLAGLHPLRLQRLPLGLLQWGEVIVQAPLGARKVLLFLLLFSPLLFSPLNS